MKNTLMGLIEENGLQPVFVRIVRIRPEFKKTMRSLKCLQWKYVGRWGELERTFEYATKSQNVYRVGIAQGKCHIYKQGEYGSWAYQNQTNRCRTKFGEVLAEILIKAEMDAKGGRYQWPA